ncbi:AAA family ATPase [Geodermatophilus sabuli]|uniref:5-methylcytosine-specific restriction enzyme B n=1 Tax=Geodermatophilus sabuli TaxID=1564158 RepID=A0A285EIG6_9ACTN|nr:AAA family ATPase [Geodermatophilus sabuli]MBB3086557.1 5-methylcytosine-specific restriction protein B [Geodermatophilus sabuli]SNX97791.1 5-methylcytosine-specific restriction enzyme B [Geodermatophilus sabuli]
MSLERSAVELDRTVLESIESALRTWDPTESGRLGETEQLREDFTRRFHLEAWPTLPIESYALGQQTPGGTVCWWMEFHTRSIASMSGGSSYKHLIFLRSSDRQWRFPREYDSVGEAWEAVRSGFVEAFRLASADRFDEIDDIRALRGAPALLSKLLFVYFPAELLPVCSKTHVDHFLRRLGQPASNWSAIQANRQLLGVLRAVPQLRGRSTQELGFFLYHWADPRAAVDVVKIAPGERGTYWQECLDGGYICVGWDDVGDLAQYESKEAFRAAFREHYSYGGNEAQVSRKSNELWTLVQLQPGDKVVANRGVSEVLAIGTVTEEGYSWRKERPEYRHTVAVDWDTSFARTIEPVRGWATTTVSKVSADLLRRITAASPIAGPKAVAVDPLYVELEQALRRRGQVVLYGPPGTGKTYTARRAAVWLLEGGTGSAAAEAVLVDEARMAARERELASGSRPDRQVWVMVANPAHEWSWSRLFDDGVVEFSVGRLKRNFPRVRAGDLVVGYESTPTKAVVALARVTTEYDPDAPCEAAIALEPVTRIASGLTYEELQSDPVLSASEPARFRCQGTLFELTPVEAERLLGLLGERDPAVAVHAGGGARRLTRVTFHPSYAYEDFVEGFRPRESSVAGALDLTLTDGIFKEVCSTAAADPSRPHVLLIDEINRGNIPKVFGELITLIEKDKRGLPVRLPQSGQDFAVPSNLHIIGTMNTADRSIHLLDTALRRRFAFIELLPDAQLLSGSTAGALALDLFLENLNERVRSRLGREKQVGHALFFDGPSVVDSAEQFAAIFRHELLPLLQEYLYEDYDELGTVLGSVIDVAAQTPSAVVDDPEELCAALAAHFSAHASA